MAMQQFMFTDRQSRYILGYQVDGDKVWVIPEHGDKFRSLVYRNAADVQKSLERGHIIRVSDLVHSHLR